MFDFCYGRMTITNCIHWVQHMPIENLVLLVFLGLAAVFLVLRLFYWIFGDFDLW